MTIQSLITALSRQGLRVTPLRKKLMEIFVQKSKPLSVPELQENLGEKGLHPNKTSLYRQIESLVKTQIIEEVKLTGVQKYELTQNHHHHFVCETCNEVVDFHNLKLEKSLERVEEKLSRKGHEIKTHSINLYGTCETCKA